MTDYERQAEIADVRNKLGLSPNVRNKLVFPIKVDEGPYEDERTEEIDTNKQADAPNPKDAINIDSNEDNDKDDEDKEDINSDTKE